MNKKRWIGCFLWLAAWAVWVWFGVRLHRELPRDVPPIVTKLLLEEIEVASSEVDGDVVSTKENLVDESLRVRFWNACDGKLIQEKIFPAFKFLPIAIQELDGRGFTIGTRKDDAFTLYVMNQRTGETKKLGPTWWEILSVHPTKPWAAIKTSSDVHLGPKLFVVDLETNKRLFEWSAEPPSNGAFDHIGMCRFLADSDELLILRHRVEDGWMKVRGQELLRISMKSGEVTLKASLEKSFRWMSAPAANGRVVLRGINERPDRLDVVDTSTGQTVFTFTGVRRSKDFDDSAWTVPPILAPNGKLVLSPQGDLFDVDTGKIVWTPKPDLEISELRKMGPKSFTVAESWAPLLKSFYLPFEWSTEAVRRLDDGSVVYRVWQNNLEVPNIDQHWAVEPTGAIHAWPPRVNWVLLCGCQAILALPLVLVWLFRWRRRRTRL